LPAADAIVNPNLSDDVFPSKALAGVGVMFYLLLALRAHLRDPGDWKNSAQPELAVVLDLVALGTVADMVPRDFNNRILVEAGLRRMRQGQACAGIQALIDVAGRHAAHLNAADLGFAIGPRLNAAGRLEDMRVGIECLLSDDAATALALAERLSSINRERRDLQTSMVAQAMHLADSIANDDAMGVCVFEQDWHPGVVGLVASRLKDRLQRPVIAFAPSGNPNLELRGSARSIAGFHMRDALAEVDRREPGLIPRFGGHAMAAGLSLAATDLPRFAACFDAVARERIGSELLDAVLWSDGELQAGECGMALAQQLRHAGPWGQAFPEPLFDNVFTCIQSRPMGAGHRRVRLCDPRDHAEHDAVMFQVGDAWPEAAQLRVVYELSVNDWQGRETPRLILRHVEVAT
ncbi:MAG: DHHA1 domain-containing protein, partial [Xanthomonadales bacterium]|nr:DHHA1 domain-containing protein [Xanthomonadales bacterium]